MLKGLGNTLILALAALVIGVVLGVLVAVIKVLPMRQWWIIIIKKLADIYITVLRGTPIVAQLLLGYFGFASPLHIDPLLCAMFIFGINSSAYVAEMIRAGIQAVDFGQMEAGRSLGLTYRTTMVKVILPQAIKNILPALGNELIVLIKETSVAGFVTVSDMARMAQAISANTYDVVVPYMVLAAMYLVLVLFATMLVNRFERWIRRSDHR